MDPEQQIEAQPEPAAEKPATTTSNENRRRRGRGRSRFKRDGRDRRGDHGEHGARREQPRSSEVHTSSQAQAHVHHKPAGTIGRAMEQVEEIRSELEKVLEDIQQVLQTLEQVEREKNASEEEIEMLRESLHVLQRGASQQRNFRPNPAPKPSEPAPSAVSEPEDPSQDD